MIDKTNSPINPWHPMTDAQDLKTIGKLGEESGELCQVICRCIIQGIDETDPTRDITNREWLENELADVTANMALVESRFDLDAERILERALAKRVLLTMWHKMA